MASFTYTVWSDLGLSALMNQLDDIFAKLSFTRQSPYSGKICFWCEGQEIEIDTENSFSVEQVNPPFGTQWWRGEDDIFVGISPSNEVPGFTCHITLVGFSRQEQAEIAKLLIINLVPDKQKFPDDHYVFQLSAE
jgi:hypothetical protein